MICYNLFNRSSREDVIVLNISLVMVTLNQTPFVLSLQLCNKNSMQFHYGGIRMPELVQETENLLQEYRHLVLPWVYVTEQVRLGVIDLIVHVLTHLAEGTQLAGQHHATVPPVDVAPGLGGIPVRRVDGRNGHRPSDVVDVAFAFYGRVVVAQERRERGLGGIVQVPDSAYPEEEVGTGYKRCDIACVISIGFVAFVRYCIYRICRMR